MVIRTIIVLSIAIPAIIAAQENPVDLDFERALDIVLSGSGALKSRADAVRIEEYRVGQAKSEYYPRVDLYSNYTRTSLASNIEFANPISGTLSHISLFPRDRYNFGAVFGKDLYTFGRSRARVSAARLGLERSRIERSQYRYALYDKAARVFASLLMARDNLKLQTANLKRSEDKLRIVEARIDLGAAADYDLILAKLLRSKYEDRRSQAREEFRRLKAGLKALLHWDRPYEFMPAGEIGDLAAALPESVVFQSDRILSMKTLRIGYGISKEEQTINRSAYFPGIAFFAKYDWQNGYQPDIDEIRGDWSAGLSFNWRIMDGGLRKYRLSQSRVEAEKLNNLITDLQAELNSGLESATAGLESATQQLALAGERLRLADNGLKIAESRYLQGLLGISDLLDLELDRADAELAVTSAQYRLLMAKLDLKAAVEYYPELESGGTQ